jgi:hypothetical protein
MAARFVQQGSGIGAKLKNFPIGGQSAAGIGVDTADSGKLLYKDASSRVREILGAYQTQPGAPVAGKSTANHFGATVHQTKIALSLFGANKLVVSGAADATVGVKVFDFPAGRILILGATIDGTITVNDAFNATPNDQFFAGIGTADGTQAADADLTLTEQDVIPKTTFDTASNTVLSFDFHAALGASAHFDGTTTPIDLFFNAAVPNAASSKDAEVSFDGTLTITWINLGDY